MTPQRFAEANIVMGAPPQMPECSDIHAYRNGTIVVTAWRPSPEEMVKINLGEPIYLLLWGSTMQPALVTADNPFTTQQQEPDAAGGYTVMD